MDFSGRTILIVDDDRIIAMAEASFLNKNGYNAITAGTGDEVCKILESGIDCHMVLLDIDLGNGLNGPETAEKILQLRDLPIIFVTSHTEGDMTEKVKRIRKYGYVVKNSGDFVILSTIEMAFELFYERHRAVEAGKNFEQIANTSPALIWMSGTDKLCTWFNDPWLKFTGRKIEQELGDGWTDSIHPDDKEKSIQEYTAAFDLREPFSLEYRLKRSDGEYRWVLDKGHPKYNELDIFDGYIGSCIDITERKMVEYRHEEQMNFVSTLLQTIPLPVFYKDREGRYLGCNSAFENFMKIKFDDVKGKSVFGISPREIAEKYHDMDEDLFRNRGTQSYEWVVKSFDGELRYVVFNKATFNDHAGNVAGLIGVILDITDQKAYEEKITNLLNEKDVLLKEKEALLREVHHRIKNNMSTISSLLHLQADALNDPSAAAALDDARSRVMSMMIIYDKLYRSDDFRNIGVRDYLVNLIHEIFSTFPDRKKLNINYVVDDFILDSKLLFPLGIIINELLTNSMKHAFPGGREGKIDVSVKIYDNGFIEASVSDDGIGIPESVDLRRTQSFGLNLINLLADQIGGSIIVNRMEGTQFIIKFRKD
ncbi:MAG TPA: PAS domain S-box protein [Spirochaetota bacterium]|nr:PAS domain S-box protein [Spirochaetota bacterium]HPS86496.1 PAS domain S-box protein [Spirochaetota bacterium]